MLRQLTVSAPPAGKVSRRGRARAGRRHRRGHHRHERRVPPRARRLPRRGAAREGRADERLDLSGGRPRHAVQPVARDDAAAPLLDRAVRELGVFETVGSLRIAAGPESLKELQRGSPAPAGSASTPSCSAPTRRCERMPAASPRDLYGAVWMPGDGYLDPHRATYALADAARELGVEIRTQTRVTGIELAPAGRCGPSSRAGAEIECESSSTRPASGRRGCRRWSACSRRRSGRPPAHRAEGGAGPRAAARHAVLPRHRQPRLRQVRVGWRAVRRLRGRAPSRWEDGVPWEHGGRGRCRPTRSASRR